MEWEIKQKLNHMKFSTIKKIMDPSKTYDSRLTWNGQQVRRIVNSVK